MNKFTELGLNPAIIKALIELGFETPTPIQAQAIPHVLNSDQDLVALAQTGTGKTAAFGLPVLHQIDSKNHKTQAIILCPTRELCLQIHADLAKYAKYSEGVNVVAVYGGSSIGGQIKDLKRGAQIVVGTPGRVQDLIDRRALNISEIQWLVLDEADEMLNMGFKEEIDKILITTPKTKRTLLFSATMPRGISMITKQYMKNPFEISVGEKNGSSKKIQHVYYIVPERERYETLRRVLDVETDIYGIVFCRTKVETQEVASKLMQDGYPAEAIHGDLSQDQRTKVMARFRKRNIQILVATDVAARGIDVKDLTHVINYNLPDSLETYTHRSGRTGRADKSGISIVIVNLKEQRQIRTIEKRVGVTFEKLLVPKGEDIVARKLAHLLNLVEDLEVLPEAEKFMNDYLATIENKFEYKDIALKLLNLHVKSVLTKYKNAPDVNVHGTPRDFGRDGGGQFGRDFSGRNRSAGGRDRTDDRRRGGAGRDDSAVARGGDRDRTRRPAVEKNYVFVEVNLNLGRKDDFSKKDLFQLINAQRSLKGAEIGTIEVGSTQTVFEIDKNLESAARKFLPGTKFNGKDVDVI